MSSEDNIIVRPRDTGVALANPGMGWVFHYFDNSLTNYGSRLAPGDTVDDFPGLTVLYLRLAWSYLEPEEGRFNWSIVDTPAQAWRDKGRQLAFRFTACESSVAYATPQWVKEAGAAGNEFTVQWRKTDTARVHWEPEYGDPVFLEKLDRFLAAAARRYDNHPDVAFIDIGSVGVWGEGHTFASTGKKVSVEVMKKHIDLHRKHFKNILLVSNDDYDGPEHPGPDFPVNEYALSKGLTLRDDSICVQPPPKSYFHANLAQRFWPAGPVVLESEHYGMSQKRGAWGDGSGYLQAVEDYHASYASIHWWPREFLEENRELVDRMNRRLGYRLQLVEAAWPSSVKAGTDVTFSFRLRNAGVAPCLPGGHPALTLKHLNGAIAAVETAGRFNVRCLPVGPPEKALAEPGTIPVRLPTDLPAGDYGVYFSVGALDGTPRLALPLEGDDGRRRYRLGSLQVTAG